MKKRLIVLLALCSILLCSCDNSNDKPKFTGIPYVSNDEEGKIDPEEAVTRSTLSDGGVDLSNTTRVGGTSITTTKMPTDTDSHGEIVPGVTTVDYHVDPVDTTTTIDLITDEQETDVFGNPVWGEPTEVSTEIPEPITKSNAHLATGSQINYYYTESVPRGYADADGNMLSITGELLTVSSKSYEDIVNEFKGQYGFDYLTLHIDDYYETYWFTDLAVYSALYVNNTAYECYSRYSDNLTGFDSSIQAVSDLKEGTYDSSIVGSIIAGYGMPKHTDMHNVIWYIDAAPRKYDPNDYSAVDADNNGYDDRFEGRVTSRKYICYNIATGKLIIKEIS